jgi:hypothetical protein
MGEIDLPIPPSKCVLKDLGYCYNTKCFESRQVSWEEWKSLWTCLCPQIGVRGASLWDCLQT